MSYLDLRYMANHALVATYSNFCERYFRPAGHLGALDQEWSCKMTRSKGGREVVERWICIQA